MLPLETQSQGMITLCFDFGNTRSKVAVFENNTLLETIDLADDLLDAVDGCLKQYQPANSILCSVVDHDLRVEEILANHTRFHKISYQSNLNYKIQVSKPETIGPDRLAILAAARNLYPDQNTLVVAAGTCITYNFINKFGEFLGGAISPGMEMRFKAMHTETAKLPLVKPDWNPPIIGYDTASNLKSGVIWGIVHEIDGFIEQYSNRYGCFNAVLTGGNGVYFAGQLKNRIFADPNFLFKGLLILSELNN